MHSDDERRKKPGSSIVAVTGLSPEAMDSMEQLQKDYRAVSKLMPKYADLLEDVSLKNALLVAAEYCHLLQHDEQEFKRELSAFLQEDPLVKNELATQAVPLLDEYDFTIRLLADRARYFCAAMYEAHGLNSAIRKTADSAASFASQQPLYYQLEKGRPYLPNIHHVRRESSWKKAFPNFMLSEMLDFVGDALNDAYYPKIVLEEHALWGERYIAFDTFVDKTFTDDCEDIESFQEKSHEGISKHSFRVLPIVNHKEWDIEKTHGIGIDTPPLDEILYGRDYLEKIDDAKKELALGPQDVQLLPIENVLKVYYLSQHALAQEELVRELDAAKKRNPSNRPDITFAYYENLVKAHRHILANEMQEYVCSLRSRFATLRMDGDADHIGAEWEQMLRDEN